MNGPRRLSEEDRALAALLSAARGYRAPARTRRRVVRMLGLPVALSLAAAAATPSAASVLSALSGLSVKVWIIAGMAVAVAGGGTAVLVHRDRVEAAPAPVGLAPVSPVIQPPASVPARASLEAARPRQMVASSPVPRVPARRSALLERRAARVTPVPLVTPVPVPLSPAPLVSPPLPRSAPSRPGRATRGPVPSTLTPELALLRSAEQALRTGAHAQALDLLDRYRRQFPAGGLREEADVLAIDTHLRAGRRAQATEQALRFLASHPGSVLSSRVRAMLSRARAR
jgi:hypothetical protein